MKTFVKTILPTEKALSNMASLYKGLIGALNLC